MGRNIKKREEMKKKKTGENGKQQEETGRNGKKR